MVNDDCAQISVVAFIIYAFLRSLGSFAINELWIWCFTRIVVLYIGFCRDLR